MKSLLIYTMCVIMIFSLAACGRSSDSAESASFEESASSVPESKILPEDSQNYTEQESLHDDEAFRQQEDENLLKVTEMKLNVDIDGKMFTATLGNNAAVEAFIEMMREAPVVIRMSDYSGFEKVGALGTSLPASNSQMTTHTGDIVLYNGNEIVIFYGSNSWSYTMLGKIDDRTGWEEALGSGNVTVTFSIE